MAILPLFHWLFVVSPSLGENWRALPSGERPSDHRLGPLRTLDGYFPFQEVDSVEAWEVRSAKLRRQVAVANGQWPEPTRTPLHEVVHSPVDRDDYQVWRVYFESFPGHYVTGSLYRPKGEAGRRPAILSPHGHWPKGRFHQSSDAEIRDSIAMGAERFLDCGRYPLQARCVQLARMGCVVFLYDAVGAADSIQLEHRPGVREAFNTREHWGLGSPQADLYLQNWMGLQTWNGLRALDFLISLPDVDSQRVAVTGASGGATQTMMIMARDSRPVAAAPCVMVSTSMQGGCSCENAPYLRIGAGNVDIAALIAPRHAGIMSANDWTVEFAEKGHPQLAALYEMLGVRDRLQASFHTHFGHNYNSVNRMFMYGVINDALQLGLEKPILERQFVPLTPAEATVWTDSHPRPTGNSRGGAHERALVRWWYDDLQQQLAAVRKRPAAYRELMRGGWETILGRTHKDVGEVTVKSRRPFVSERFQGEIVLLENLAHNEQVPLAIFYPESPRQEQEVVIWITDGGKQELVEQERQSQLGELLESGYYVIGIDCIGQGEFLVDGAEVESTRMSPRVYGERDSEPWRFFSGYTFGYNFPLFSQRVHDVLTAVQGAGLLTDAELVHLVGCGEQSGAIALAAKTVSGSEVQRVSAGLGDFQFSQIERFDHPMFLPGAARYGDIDGLVTLIDADQLLLDRSANSAADGEHLIKPFVINQRSGSR